MEITRTAKLTAEQWQEFIDLLKHGANITAQTLLYLNHEGRGQEDHDDYLASITVAVSAMEYVKEFAADKVLFAATKKGIVH